MQIKKIGARAILDSRKERTIQIIVHSDKGNFITNAPAGKSKGKYEAPSYKKSLEDDIDFINKLSVVKINKIINKTGISLRSSFSVLKDIEKIVLGKVGGNTLFALEASLLKMFAYENKKELWEFLLGNFSGKIKFPRPVGNAIGGGLHSKGRLGKKPDFQEFLFIPNCKYFKQSVRLNEIAYYLSWKMLSYWIKKRNDEGAWETGLSNGQVLEIMNEVKKEIKKRFRQKIDIGIDCASSGFFKNGFYYYDNPSRKFNINGQIDYISYLIKRYELYYIEDPIDEEDFKSFSELKKKGSRCLIVGDDLTATNPSRLEEAIKNNSISGIIIKPNQIGSLLKMKRAINLAKKNKIKTIISHRSGETTDNTIADLCIGFQCDFIKTGIYGKTRKSKLKRLIQIENQLFGELI